MPVPKIENIYMISSHYKRRLNAHGNTLSLPDSFTKKTLKRQFSQTFPIYLALDMEYEIDIKKKSVNTKMMGRPIFPGLISIEKL